MSNYFKKSQYQQQAHNEYCKQLAAKLSEQMYFFPEVLTDFNPNSYIYKMLAPYIEQTFDNDVSEVIGYVISDLEYFTEELDIDSNSPDVIEQQRKKWRNKMDCRKFTA